MKTINLYTDGACSNNQSDQNIGGWGTILEYGDNVKTLYGGQVNTTNNIMEMTAVISGLKALKSTQVKVNVFSDSAYVVNCFNQNWYKKWQMNGWINSAKKPVENKELWVELIDLVESISEIHFYQVKGHLKVGTKDFDKWHNKFNQQFGTVSKDFYAHLIERNNEADALANQGVDDIKAALI
ncbi:MAG: ribonuclease HI [Clostridia bacterium]|nr:ribonuclease HI [Clostridia bacterium]